MADNTNPTQTGLIGNGNGWFIESMLVFWISLRRSAWLSSGSPSFPDTSPSMVAKVADHSSRLPPCQLVIPHPSLFQHHLGHLACLQGTCFCEQGFLSLISITKPENGSPEEHCNAHTIGGGAGEADLPISTGTEPSSRGS